MLLQGTAKRLLSIAGWKSSAHPPGTGHYVLVGAHHTSNWDFPLALIGMRAMGIPFHWVAKHTLFFWPLGIVMRFLGGIAVNRTVANNFVDEAATLFATHQHFVLAIAPDGTRSRAGYWKTGFYWIALKAQVPIAFGYLDYKNKMIGITEGILPSGDIDKDMQIMRDFFSCIQGKYPQNETDVVLRAED